MLVIILNLITLSFCYQVTCLTVNSTSDCATQIVTDQSQVGSWYSYYTPEESCSSCVGNSTCNNTNPSCVKSLLNFTTRIMDLQTQSILTPRVVTYPSISMPLPTYQVGNQFAFSISNKRQISVVISYDDGTIYVTSSDLPHTMVTWNLNEFYDNFYCSSDCQYTIPKSRLIKDGTLTVKVFISDTLVSTRTFVVQGAQTCQIQECTFICWSYITNFVCYSSTVQAIIGFSLIVSCLFLTTMLIWINYKIYCCLKVKYIIPVPERVVNVSTDEEEEEESVDPFELIKGKTILSDVEKEDFHLSLFGHTDFLRNHNGSWKLSNSTNPVETHSDGVSEEYETSEAPLSAPNWSAFNIPKGPVILLFLALIISINGQCISTTSLTSEVMTCTNLNQNNTCSFSLNQGIILGKPGNKACFRLMDKAGFMMANINLTYVDSIIKVTTRRLYYSANYNIAACSYKSCRGFDRCTTGQGCSGTDTQIRDGFNGPCSMYPGWGVCAESCGCAGCGCGLCSSACTEGTIGFNPISNTLMDVYEIVSAKSIPTILVSQQINGTTTTFTLDLSSPVTNSQITYSLIGSYDGTTAYFNNKGYVVTGGNAYFGEISTLNNPQFGQVGDIQAAVSSAFNSPSRTAFIVPATNRPVPVTQPSTLAWTFPPQGYTLLNSLNRLPMTLGGISWSPNGTYPIGLNTDPPAVTIFLQSPFLKVNYLRTLVCPDLLSSTESISGCYACPAGFTVTVSIKSLCDSGTSDVSFSDPDVLLATSYVFCSLSYTKVTIYGQTFKRSLQGSLCFKSGDKQDCVNINTVLAEAPTLTQQEVLEIYGNLSESGGPQFGTFGMFWDSLTGTAAAVKYSFIIGLVLSLISILVSVFALAYSFHRERQSGLNYQSLRDIWNREY